MSLPELTLIVVAVILALAVSAGMWRLSIGPTTLDRMLGFDLITVIVMAMVLVFSATTQSTDYVDFVVVLSGLGFLTTVAYFYYLMQLDPTDDEFDVGEEP